MHSSALSSSMDSGLLKSRSSREKTNESLPDHILVEFDACAVQHIVKDLAKHYEVAAAFVALESPEELKLKASYGISLRSVGHSSIAKHGIARDLPIIIEDVKNDRRFAQDPLTVGPPAFGFFAGSPLMITSRRCVGSLCIMDHARRAFSLQDAAFLDECARAVCEIYKPALDAQDLWNLTVSSLISIDNAEFDEEEEDEDHEERGCCYGHARSLGSLPEE